MVASFSEKEIQKAIAGTLQYTKLPQKRNVWKTPFFQFKCDKTGSTVWHDNEGMYILTKYSENSENRIQNCD